jgi:NAD(P)-dependent dehydrogenase (short-subunit alcohol dehydrogenase family)
LPLRIPVNSSKRKSIVNRLEGRTALVTGAASGIGRASAILFAQEGARVVVVDRSKDVETTAASIREAGGQVTTLVMDASSEDDVARAVDTAVEQYGSLDVCFANAGISGGARDMNDLTANDWMQVLNVNLIGTFVAIKHAARVMVPQRRGSIICTASVAGLRSGAGGLPYSASKAGVINLVQTTANRFAGTGIRVNAICPGLIETGMTRLLFEAARARGTEGRIGQLNPLRPPPAPPATKHPPPRDGA